MRLGIGAEKRERHVCGNLIVQNVVGVAQRAHLAQLSDAVAVLVDPHVAFDIQHPAHGWVGVVRVHHEGHDCRVPRLGFVVDAKHVALTGKLFDLFAVVAHRHQFAHRLKRAVPDIGSVVEVACFAGNQELFGRNRLNDCLVAGDLAPDRDVKRGHGRRNHLPIGGHDGFLHYRLGHVDQLAVGIFKQQVH